MEDNKFAQHIYFDRPREGAPDFVKGRMSMRRDDAVTYLQSLPVNEKGYVQFDLLASKDNTRLYFKLNDFKPKEVAKEDLGNIPNTNQPYPDGAETVADINPEDIPF